MISMTLLAIIYISFVSLGLPDSVLGAAWPTMVTQLSAPMWGAGLVQMTVSFFTIVSSLNSARLIRALGTGKLTAFSVALTAAALLGYSVVPHYAWLVLLAIPMGLGAGGVDSALNNYVALHCEPRHMSWLHCFWGLGTIIGPVILSAAMAQGMVWRMGYRVIGILQVVLCVVLFGTLNLWKQDGLREEERSAKVLTVPQVLALPGAKPGMVAFFCYCALESTLLLWVPTYLVMVRGISEVQAAAFGTLFCIGMTAGRAASGFMTLKFTPEQLVRIGQAVLVAGCLMLLVPVNAVAFAGVVVCGLGCAPIYPNIMQDTPVNYGAENSQAAIGVQMSFAYVGCMFVPTIFATIADVTGYGLLPYFVLGMAVAMLLLFNRQKRIVKNRTR